MGESEEIVDDTRISFHVVGYWPQDESVFIESLNPQKIWGNLDSFETQYVLRYMCIQAVNPRFPDEPAELVGCIRVQTEGEKLAYYHSFFVNEDNPSPEHRCVMNGALLRIAVSQTGFITERDGAERVIEGFAFMERELNWKPAVSEE